MLSLFSCVQLFATPGTVAHHASLSMVFFRQESWRGLPFPPPGNLPAPGIKPSFPVSPALQVESLLLWASREALIKQLIPLWLGHNLNLQPSDIPLKTREIIKKKKKQRSQYDFEYTMDTYIWYIKQEQREEKIGKADFINIKILWFK